MLMVWQDMKYDPQAIDARGRERIPDDINFDADLFSFYQKAIAFRRQQHPLNHGDFDIVKADDDQRCLITRRHSEKGTVLAAFNRSEVEATLTLPPEVKPEIALISSGEAEAGNLLESADGYRVTISPLTGRSLTADQWS